MLERTIINIFLPKSHNVCFGYSKEPSHCDGSFEYPKQIFVVEKEEGNFSFIDSYLEA